MAKANKALDTSNTTVEVLEELTPDEERERHRLEIKIDRAISESWLALKQLRDRRLYRSTHKTFEEYAKHRFGYNRAHAYRLIAAAGVLENLSPNGRQNDELDQMSPIGRHSLPSRERLCRELAKLPSSVQPLAWSQVLEVSEDKAPTTTVVKSIVERLLEKPLFLADEYCKVSEVFFLQRLTGAEKKYNGCWAIAIEVENRFTVKAIVYRETVEVKQENILRIDSEQTQAEIRKIYQDIKQLLSRQLDPIDEVQIELLCRRPWFTERQKDVLAAMMKAYGVD